MRMQEAPGAGLHMTNNLGRLAAEKGLSEQQVAALVAGILGRPLDSRTLRRYLRGDRIEDSTMATVAALAKAIGVGLDAAVALERDQTLDEVLTRAGVRFHSPQSREPLHAGFWTIDPRWGDLVDAFLADREREI